MNRARKTAEAREKDLKLAILRIERGRAQTKATKVNFTTVALEAGVSTSLIHNCHPDIAELIRSKTGRSSRQQRDAKQNELKEEKNKNKQLRRELKEAQAMIANLASINETLLIRVRALEAEAAGENIRTFPRAPLKNS
ncbi:TetR family transcriptional regulator [Burkholderia pseudomallei]|uniref:TetR family transcriptional regulator n=1 Tax=Burkholderia pseudomallei TaxID=28450 RepID=UPI0029339B16|nr:TetR family transcriptional regulator [Burkholderia pseudomallei]MDV2161226.1 TetR family transcriptional regulator [Burkholderia pseudomallei]MDV2236435.1 TetR family transcriptional regulator [Burkholderia pseudomallei]